MIIQSEKQTEWKKRVAQQQDLDGPMELSSPGSSGGGGGSVLALTSQWTSHPILSAENKNAIAIWPI